MFYFPYSEVVPCTAAVVGGELYSTLSCSPLHQKTQIDPNGCYSSKKSPINPPLALIFLPFPTQSIHHLLQSIPQRSSPLTPTPQGGPPQLSTCSARAPPSIPSGICPGLLRSRPLVYLALKRSPTCTIYHFTEVLLRHLPAQSGNPTICLLSQDSAIYSLGCSTDSSGHRPLDYLGPEILKPRLSFAIYLAWYSSTICLLSQGPVSYSLSGNSPGFH